MEHSCAELLEQGDYPFIFTGMIGHWKSCSWTPTHLAEMLPGKSFKCKLAPRNSDDHIWETDCVYTEASMLDFCEWTSCQHRGDNPLSRISPDEFSCYIDYKYMSKMFENSSHVLKDVDWSVFGLTGRNGEDSTIWIGSEGASTPCHYDTYGFNLVAQIHGKKRWHLFPPSSSDCLYPTRLPYEESSVFSEVNVGHPDLAKTPQFRHSRAVVVTLEPGQVLYVPRHWWHYVECVTTAVSINTWVELLEDDESRLTESISRATISCLVSSETGHHLTDWVNPNEDIMPMDVNWTYLQKCLETVVHKPALYGKRKSMDRDNLKIFANHFKNSQYRKLHFPWIINKTIHKMDAFERGGDDLESSNGSDVADKDAYRNKSTSLLTRKRGHSCKYGEDVDSSERTPHQDSKNDNKRLRILSEHRSTVSDSGSDTCKVFVLQPCTFENYYNVVHGVEWSGADVCDETSVGKDEAGVADETKMSVDKGSASSVFKVLGSALHRADPNILKTDDAVLGKEVESCSVEEDEHSDAKKVKVETSTKKMETDPKETESHSKETELDSKEERKEGGTNSKIERESDAKKEIVLKSVIENGTETGSNPIIQKQRHSEILGCEESVCIENSSPEEVSGGTFMMDGDGDEAENQNKLNSDSSVSSRPTANACCPGDVTSDLSHVRDKFFRTLLHPRVVKVIAEELVRSSKYFGK